MPALYQNSLGRVDRSLAGLDALTNLLHAQFLAEEQGAATLGLGTNLTDQLFFAAAELVSSAREKLHQIIEAPSGTA